MTLTAAKTSSTLSSFYSRLQGTKLVAKSLYIPDT
jgi:hypothetical protein